MDDFFNPDIEYTHLQSPLVIVFKLPHIKTSSGYRASEWTEQIWSGKLKIISKGHENAIVLYDSLVENKIFAVSPIKEGSVTNVIDSSRYFVLRVENNQGKHTYIGIAFNDRNDSFDFNVTLQKIKNNTIHKNPFDNENEYKNENENENENKKQKDYTLNKPINLNLNLLNTNNELNNKKNN